MKTYVHNPAIFRKHFSGQGLPAFKGARVQRGYGSLTNKLKRYAVPLLMAGATAATPHISKVAGSVAQNAAQRMFPTNPAMQRVVTKVAGKLASRAVGKARTALQKKRKRKGGVTKQKKRKATTSRNIFS